ncbi:MAG TPA: hypothetical protein VF832_15595, partial [Longimicrobiales bacterium]
MRHTTLVLVLAGASALAFAGPAAAQKDERFNWHGRVAAGQSLEIRGINGYVHAVPASGGEVVVNALKHGRRSNPADVKIEVVPGSSGVTICAVYPSSGDHPNDCRSGGGHSETRNNDVAVDFDVQIPAGVSFLGRTVNGEVTAENLSGNVDVQTVNGSVRANATGLVRAHTVNGGIDVTMGRADWTGTLELETVNGGVHVTLPANTSAEVDAATVNGGLSTDFPLTIQGRMMRNRIHGT